MLINRFTHLVYWFYIIPIIIESCNTQDEDFYIGKDFIDPQTHAIMSDTFTVNMSTVILDSFPTSGKGVALCGSYKDSLFGKVSSTGYFEVGLPELNLTDGDYYDSTVLILIHSGYSYGDTTKYQKLNIYPLREIISADEDGNCYNNQTTGIAETPIGKLNYIPRPRGVDSIFIKINDDFGLDLWQKVIDNSEIFTSTETFTAYLPGLAIVPDENLSSSIIGYKASSAEILLRIYSHRYAEYTTIINTDFLLTNTNLQYNKIIPDFSGTPLQLIKSQKEDLSGFITGNHSYLQGGTGLFTKISFPHLENFLLMGNARLLRAEIIIKPDNLSYLGFRLPEKLALLTLDKYNRIQSAFYNSSGDLVTANFVLDSLYHEDSYYAFDITSYLMQEFADSYVDKDKNLAISLHPDNLYTTFERLMVEQGTSYPKLRIYFVNF